MVDKTKFIIIGLIGFVVISLFITLQTINAKQAAERERDILKRENASLATQINETQQENQRLKDRFNLLAQEVDKVSRERDELQKKYALLVKDKDELVEKLKARPVAGQLPAGETQAAAIPDDTYWGKVLKEKTGLELQLDNIRQELKSLQIKNEELQRDKSTLELEVRNQVREKQDIKRQMEYNQKLMDTLSQEIVREKNDKFQIQDSLKSIRAENLTLRRQLKSLNNRKISLERKLAELQNKSVSLESSFNEMGDLLKDRMTQIDNLKRQLEPARVSTLPAEKKQEAVELPPIVVRPKGPATEETAPVLLTGKVLAVNRDNNFVIIDLGEEAGVTMGNSFGVYRAGQQVAEIEVIQVRKNISACDIKKETSPIKAGDLVR
jgi:chromosome segregation ATPase